MTLSPFVSAEGVSGFAPAARADARVLVLGTMPGVASLRAGRYYAHPRNAFWPIAGALLGFDAALPYEARIDAVNAAGVALWDVLAACVRPGSLDAAIDARSAQANDFAGFLAAHPRIARICFNGGRAQALFRRHVLPALSRTHPHMEYAALPSTSPAHAAMPYAAKLQAWRPIVPDQRIAP